jgi:tetratricopeptide (TPR) repeat protein
VLSKSILKLISQTQNLLFVRLGLATAPKSFSLPTLLCQALKAITQLFSASYRLSIWLRLYQILPGLAPVPVEVAGIYIERNQWDEAEFWLERALARHPLHDAAYHALADLYRFNNEPVLLRETLEKWLAICPNNGELLLALSDVLSRIPEMQEEAIFYAKRALSEVTDGEKQADLYLNLGDLYQQNTMCLEAAMIAYHTAISLRPDYLEAYVQLGTLYYDCGEYKLAQSVFEKALVLSPRNSRILCNLGYLAWLQEETTVALDYYQKSIAEDPSYDVALNNLGVLYLDHIGDIAQAMALFQQTLQINPEYALCYYNLGRAYSFQGHAIEAAQCFRKAQVLNETTEELDSRELSERIQQLFETPAVVQDS